MIQGTVGRLVLTIQHTVYWCISCVLCELVLCVVCVKCI
jgi:hypothetical protein